MEVNKSITHRWSPVAFSDRAVDEEIIGLLFEAARWAPSSFNAQPWNFIWGGRGGETYSMLFDLLSEANRKWAHTAPLLVLTIAETIPPGRNSVNRFAFYDTGMAVGNLLVQATTLGLFVHQMGGFDAVKAKELLHLPGNFEPAAMMAIGYKGDPGLLPKDIAERENRKRERKSPSEFVFRGKL